MPTSDATARDIITLMLQSINASAAAGTPAPEDMDFALQIVNGMLNAFVADRLNIFNVDFTEYALTANVSEYAIGPGGSGDFEIAIRPSTIVSAQLRIPNGSGPPTYLAMAPLDDDGWARIPVLDVPAQYPTAFYYSPSWPDGLLRLWGVPGAGLYIRIETWNQFSEFTDLDTAFSFPQGYYDLILWNGAERLCVPRFGMSSVPPTIRDRAAVARKNVESLNMTPPAQMIADGGLVTAHQKNATSWRNIYNPTPVFYRN